MYLYMSLWLHKSSHNSKAGIEVTRSAVCSHSRNDGVVGPLAWSQGIRV